MIASKALARLIGIIPATMLTGSILFSTALAQTPADNNPSNANPAIAIKQSFQPHTSSPYRATAMSTHAAVRYESLWGINSLEVKAVESGQLIRFSYFVMDAARAAQLNDKKATPSLIDEQARVWLEVPTLEKVGQLRQSTIPESGRSYWMVFSNKGEKVKPGDRVSIVVGRFRADGLLVR